MFVSIKKKSLYNRLLFRVKKYPKEQNLCQILQNTSRIYSQLVWYKNDTKYSLCLVLFYVESVSIHYFWRRLYHISHQTFAQYST